MYEQHIASKFIVHGLELRGASSEDWKGEESPFTYLSVADTAIVLYVGTSPYRGSGAGIGSCPWRYCMGHSQLTLKRITT